MAFDFKKECKELYAPKKGSNIVEVPPMHFVAVRAVETLTIEEGLCVQCLHIGSYDDEPATVEAMHAYVCECGYALDLTQERRHHEIYLSDARKVAPDKLKTVIRHPIRVSQQKQ